MTYTGVTLIVLVSFGVLAWTTGQALRGVATPGMFRQLGITGTRGYHLVAYSITLIVLPMHDDDGFSEELNRLSAPRVHPPVRARRSDIEAHLGDGPMAAAIRATCPRGGTGTHVAHVIEAIQPAPSGAMLVFYEKSGLFRAAADGIALAWRVTWAGSGRRWRLVGLERGAVWLGWPHRHRHHLAVDIATQFANFLGVELNGQEEWAKELIARVDSKA